jgi:L-gulono-1,4-lactone dehydrogenase
MPDFKTNYTYENWAHTLKFKPERFCEPETEQQVIDTVKDALARRGHVRTRGGGHSWSHFVVTDDTLIQLDHLNKGLIADVLNHRYTVQAGIRLKDLIQNLALDGLAMRNLGSITQQSIAGAISTGTHGTGIRLGNLSTSIVGMKLVTGTGDLLAINETDVDLLDAARVSVGALGIITQVTIQCVPMYELEHTTYFCKFDDVIDKLESLNQENERFLLWWLVAPIGPKDNVLVVTMNPPGTPPGLLGQAGTKATAGGNPLPMDTNDLLSMVLNLFPNKPFHQFLKRKGRYDQILTIPLLPVLHREFEYAIPAENAGQALRSLRRIFDEGDISTTLPVEVRFVAADHSLLSPARGKNVCYIGVSTQPNANEVYSRVEPVMKDFGGRPHWGKHFSLTRGEVESMYPDSYDKFCNIRKQLDPHGVFTNTLVQQLFD